MKISRDLFRRVGRQGTGDEADGPDFVDYAEDDDGELVQLPDEQQEAGVHFAPLPDDAAVVGAPDREEPRSTREGGPQGEEERAAVAAEPEDGELDAMAAALRAFASEDAVDQRLKAVAERVPTVDIRELQSISREVAHVLGGEAG